MHETSPPAETGLSISGFKYNNDAILDAFEFKKANDPAFKNVTSLCAFAEKFGLSESTCKRVFKGRATDFTVSVLWYICKILGLDPAVVLYLPVPNRTTSGADAAKIAALEERDRQHLHKIDELQCEIERKNKYEKELRERLLSVSDQLAHEKANNAQLDDVKGKKRTLAVCLLICICLFVAFAGMSVYFLWELQNPEAGNWQF